MTLKNYLLLSFFLFSFTLNFDFVSSAWYSSNWSNAINYTPSNITMPYGDNQGYVHLLVLNSSITGFSYTGTNTSGSDIIFMEGSHNDPNLTTGELRYYTLVWNTTGNSVFAVVTNSSVVTSLVMYYNNTLKSPSSNITTAFKLFGEACDSTSQWTTAGIMVASGGICNFTYGGDSKVSNTTKAFRASNISVLASLDWTSNPSSANKIFGFANGIGDPWGETNTINFRHNNDNAATIPNLYLAVPGSATATNMSLVVNPTGTLYGKFMNFDFKLNDTSMSYTNIDKAIGGFAQRTTNPQKDTVKSLAFTLISTSGGIKADWIAIRNWSTSEPSWSASSVSVFTPSSTYPVFTNVTIVPSNNSYWNYSQQINFSSTISPSNSTSLFQLNNINYSLTNSSSWFNYSFFNKLSAGNYQYIFYSWNGNNSTTTFFNYTSLFNYLLNKAYPLLILTCTTPLTYGTSSDCAGSETNNGDG
ncbi:MAG: hypothetical protein H7836_12895, partial [Magnetococcus sp. YQC-3]